MNREAGLWRRPFDLASPRVLALAGFAIVFSLPLLNGYPFLYADTGGYLDNADILARFFGRFVDVAGSAESFHAGPAGALRWLTTAGEDDLVMLGRSPYYSGLMLASAPVLGVWGAAAIQAYAVSYLVALAMRHGFGATVRPYLAVMFALTYLTPLGVFAGLLTPDVWAGALLLAVATLLAFGPRLSAIDIGMVVAITAYATIVHATHLLLLVALTALAAVSLWALPRRFGPVRRPWVFASLALCILVGIGASAAFKTTVERAFGAPPVRLPYIAAHLVDAGPGTDFLREECPGAGFELCRHVDRLPVDWRLFLFDPDPEAGVFGAQDPAGRRRIAEQDFAFGAAVFGFDPVATSWAMASDAAEQLARFRFTTVPFTSSEDKRVESLMPKSVTDGARASLLYDRPAAFRILNFIVYVVAALSFGLVVVGMSGCGPCASIRADPRRMAFAAAVIAGVALNGMICGALASPYDRFQARIVWLVPALAGIALAAAPAPPGRRARPTGSDGTQKVDRG